jgi:hypothetical protein
MQTQEKTPTTDSKPEAQAPPAETHKTLALSISETPKKPEIPRKIPIKRVVRSQVPEKILTNPELLECMKILPENYNFEIQKSIWRIEQLKAEFKKELL